MSLPIYLPETGRGMARRAPNPTELFYGVFWIIKFSFLSSLSSPCLPQLLRDPYVRPKKTDTIPSKIGW